MEHSIVKAEGISPFLQGSERDFVKARYGLKIIELDEAETVNTVLQLINKALMELGQSPTGNSAGERSKYLMAMSHLIINDVKFYFPQLTIAELGQAIRRGIRHEYGEYFGFNVISVHRFVQGYLESEDRNNALSRQKLYLESRNVPEEPSEEEKERMMEEGFEHCRQYFRRTGKILDIGNVNYQYLVDQGKLNPTIEEKQQYYRDAEKQIEHETRMEENSIQHLFNRRVVQSDNKGLIIARAKELALMGYFKKQVVLE